MPDLSAWVGVFASVKSLICTPACQPGSPGVSPAGTSPWEPDPHAGVSARDPTDANTLLPSRRFSHRQKGEIAVKTIEGMPLSRIRIVLIAVVLAVTGLLVSVSQIAPARAAAAHAAGSDGPKTTIVLEHGAWADGSSWDGVIGLLQADGYTVYAPPNALRGLANDSATLADFLTTIAGPRILLGHSYGGIVLTNPRPGGPRPSAPCYTHPLIPPHGGPPI